MQRTGCGCWLDPIEGVPKTDSPALSTHLQLRQNAPELVIHVPEASLLLRQRPPGEDRFQVHPAALHLLQQRQALLQPRQAALPAQHLVLQCTQAAHTRVIDCTALA
jgi:hypothetical protein